MELTFIPVTTDMGKMHPYLNNPFCLEIFNIYQEYYTKIPFQPPWVGYFAIANNEVVGVGGFKGLPKDNKIEIGYGTVPEKEGQGYATQICKQLVRLALENDPNIVVTARTLKEENPSTSILKKNGFKFVGVVVDPDDGEVWEWVFVPK